MLRTLVSRANLLNFTSLERQSFSRILSSPSLSLPHCGNCAFGIGSCRQISNRCSVNFASQKLEDESMAKGDKVLRLKLSTTRLDLILKAGLGISRNKIEKAFYEDRVRLNGARPKKKSQHTKEGDEIDVVRGTNMLNPLFLDVNRVEVMEIGDSGDQESDDESGDEDKEANTSVVLKRYKNLTIENYKPPWKGNPSSESQ